jgi:hypothetical protein
MTNTFLLYFVTHIITTLEHILGLVWDVQGTVHGLTNIPPDYPVL